MPANARVFVHYGPYEACGIVDFKKHRLQGLKNVLEINGHDVELREIQDWNIVNIYVNGEKVFNCDIRDLEFAGDGLLDTLCASALQKVNSAF